ncbi:hypothetical protein CR513_20054, partial [Mucuna pruriens]
MGSARLFAHFSASSSSSLCFLLSFPLDSLPSSSPCLFHPNMLGPQGSGVESKSQPISLSSSESEALAVMPESVVVIEGTSSLASAPIIPLPQRVVERYEWVSEEVLSYRSDVVWSDVNLLMVEERVCHAAQEGKGDFIYMYETAFKDLGVSLPFDCFATDVLKTLGPPRFSTITPLGLAKVHAGSPWPHSPREAYSMPKRPLTRIFLRALIKKAAQASKARASSLVPASQNAASSKDVVVAAKKVASKEAGAEKVPARPSQADPPLSAKRKAPTTVEEGTSQKKGKAIAHPLPKQVPTSTLGPKVTITSGPHSQVLQLPLGGLPRFAAPSTADSL